MTNASLHLPSPTCMTLLAAEASPCAMRCAASSMPVLATCRQLHTTSHAVMTRLMCGRSANVSTRPPTSSASIRPSNRAVRGREACAEVPAEQRTDAASHPWPLHLRSAAVPLQQLPHCTLRSPANAASSAPLAAMPTTLAQPAASLAPDETRMSRNKGPSLSCTSCSRACSRW
jgi:hypothetical protein